MAQGDAVEKCCDKDVRRRACLCVCLCVRASGKHVLGDVGGFVGGLAVKGIERAQHRNKRN